MSCISPHSLPTYGNRGYLRRRSGLTSLNTSPSLLTPTTSVRSLSTLPEPDSLLISLLLFFFTHRDLPFLKETPPHPHHSYPHRNRGGRCSGVHRSWDTGSLVPRTRQELPILPEGSGPSSCLCRDLSSYPSSPVRTSWSYPLPYPYWSPGGDGGGGPGDPGSGWVERVE